jgi:hypothetical protein
MAFNKFKKFYHRRRRIRFSSLISRERHFSYTEDLRKLSLGKLEIFPDAPYIRRDIISGCTD